MLHLSTIGFQLNLHFLITMESVCVNGTLPHTVLTEFSFCQSSRSQFPLKLTSLASLSLQNFIPLLVLPPVPLRIEKHQRKNRTESNQNLVGPSRGQKPLCPNSYL